VKNTHNSWLKSRQIQQTFQYQWTFCYDIDYFVILLKFTSTLFDFFKKINDMFDFQTNKCNKNWNKNNFKCDVHISTKIPNVAIQQYMFDNTFEQCSVFFSNVTLARNI
jgi:hypothetical protein